MPKADTLMRSPRPHPGWSLALAAAALAGALAACGTTPQAEHGETGARQAHSAALFTRAAAVFQHPRCANCHPLDDFPRQGLEGRRHALGVRRGPDNKGLPAMRCETCHQDANQDHAGVPGAPHWALAPRDMGWRGLPTGELCRAIQDPSRNGQRSLDALVEHLTRDALVAWAWAPGPGREPPPLSHEEFSTLIRAWADTGAACPD